MTSNSSHYGRIFSVGSDRVVISSFSDGKKGGEREGERQKRESVAVRVIHLAAR